MSGYDGICRRLEWDSEFFARNIASITVERLKTDTAKRALAWCREHHIDCLYFLADASDVATVRAAEDNGFRFVDVRLTLEHNLKNVSAANALTEIVRVADVSDSPALRLIAKQSHRETRFYSDPNFARSQCDALYETWIENSLNGYADAVLVAEIQDEAVGYITCKLQPSGNGQIGLFAVADRAQGRGLGQALVRESLRWFLLQGARHVTVVTQGRNVQAQRVYQRQGFRTESVKLWYHRWFTPRNRVT